MVQVLLIWFGAQIKHEIKRHSKLSSLAWWFVCANKHLLDSLIYASIKDQEMNQNHCCLDR